MKGPLDRTKVVVRHLPPTISESNFVDHVDSRFLGRYNWLSFRPGKSSQKHLIHSRAYINFNRPEDVIEFAEFFNGHVFVNEKGAQFNASVEYAPSQRVPKHCSRKDGREGTIMKDPEYLEFLEFLAKPTENLPSAEIQLERKEAERAGAVKDVPIVTPLMDYVRKKRASKGGARRSVLNGKLTRGVAGNLSKSPVSGSSKRGPGKRRTPTTMYVLRDSSKVSSKDKPTYLLVSRQDDHQFKEKPANLAVSGTNALERESGGSGSAGIGKKVLLLKGKEKEIPNVSSSHQQGASSPSKSSDSSTPVRQNPQQEAGGRIIRSILRNRDARRNQAPSESQPELRILASNQDREKRPPRSQSTYQKETNGIPDDKSVNNDVSTGHSGKQERWIKNKDRPDRIVWTPLRRSDGSHSSNDSLTSAASRTSQSAQSVDSVEDVKTEMLVNRGGDSHNTRGGRGSHSVDNGAHRHGGRRGSVYNPKNLDGLSAMEAKSSKRAGYGSHEKQVWVQKSGSGS